MAHIKAQPQQGVRAPLSYADSTNVYAKLEANLIVSTAY